MIMADAPPPPLHRLAIPYLPPFYYRTVIRLNNTLLPLIPIGCPIDIAPPFTFTLFISKSYSLAFTNVVTANASFIS